MAMGGLGKKDKPCVEASVRLNSARGGGVGVGVGVGVCSAGSRVFLLSNEREGKGWELKLKLKRGGAGTKGSNSVAGSNGSDGSDGKGEGEPETSCDAHEGHVKCLEVSECGRYVATAGEDKQIKLWSVKEKKLLWSTTLPKKPSSLAFGTGYLFVGDKVGEVHCFSFPVSSGEKTTVFGHFGTIITALAVSPCGKYIASGERNKKIRVSVLPESPEKDLVHEIQTYCVGHTSFVLTVCYVTSSILLSGGGDGTIRSWDAVEGIEKDVLAIDGNSPVLSLVRVPTGSGDLVAVLCESKKVSLVRVSKEGGLQSVCTMGVLPESFFPVSIALHPTSAALHVAGYEKEASCTEGPVYAQMYASDPAISEAETSYAWSPTRPWGEDKPLLVEDISTVAALRPVSVHSFFR